MSEYKAHPLRVQRKRMKGYRLPPDAVVVTRPTKWGNPFKVGMLIAVGGKPHVIEDAETAVELYRRWLHNGSEFTRHTNLAELAKRELRGKKLACYCGLDHACHADVLCELANS